MSGAKKACQGTVKDGWFSNPCTRTGAHEHEGKHYCKTHHPPTLSAKTEARNAAWNAQWDREAKERAVRSQSAAEQKRRADLYPDLLEALKLAAEAMGGSTDPALLPRADAAARAAIAKTVPP